LADQSSQNLERNRFRALEQLFPIFPSPAGCSKQGAKFSYLEIFDEIATSMKTARPTTVEIKDLDNPPFGFVLKREFSESGMDVYVPKVAMDEKVPKKRTAEAMRATEWLKERVVASNGEDCRWFAQELVPFLALGEIRFMCAGGVPVRDFVTGKNSGGLWSYEHNGSLKAVSRLQ
jgi:hypothetical protein